MSSDLPVVVVVIDTDVHIAALAEVFRAMMGNGILTIEDTEVVYYQGGVDADAR
jgi:PII-like signaling protein